MMAHLFVWAVMELDERAWRRVKRLTHVECCCDLGHRCPDHQRAQAAAERYVRMTTRKRVSP